MRTFFVCAQTCVHFLKENASDAIMMNEVGFPTFDLHRAAKRLQLNDSLTMSLEDVGKETESRTLSVSGSTGGR
jgi:hypothetical protein